MPDLTDLRAVAAEHNAVPGYLFTSPEQGHAVLVRVFIDSQSRLRITMESPSEDIDQQLVLDADAMRALPSDLPLIGDR